MVDKAEKNIFRDEKGRFMKGSTAALGRRSRLKIMIPREAVLEIETEVEKLRKTMNEKFGKNFAKQLLIDQICTLQKSILQGKWSCDHQGTFLDAKSLMAGYLDISPMIKSIAMLIREQRLLVQALGYGDEKEKPKGLQEKIMEFDRAESNS